LFIVAPLFLLDRRRQLNAQCGKSTGRVGSDGRDAASQLSCNFEVAHCAVEAQHEDRALLGRQDSELTTQLITITDTTDRIVCVRLVA
jgi:hypothetical protein